jgi:hypothetical protein
VVRIVACLVVGGTLSALTLPALGSPPSHVIVVSASGGGSFLEIQPAVDAALDGDTILVKNGSYLPFTVANKALVIVGDGANVSVLGEVHARDLEAAKTLALVNLKVTGTNGSDGLRLENDSGKVRASHCTFDGATLRDGGDGAAVQNCRDVAFAHCAFRGGMGVNGMLDTPGSEPGIAGRGITGSGSTVTIHECSVVGGNGESGDGGSDWDGGTGSDGCRVDQSALYAAASQFTGGNGGTGLPSSCLGATGGWAGIGVLLFGQGSIGRMLSNTAVGGTPGCDSGALCLPECYPQQPPRAGGTFVDVAGFAASIDLPTPVRENTTLPITVRGRQGDAVFLMRSDRSRNVYVPAWGSTMLVRLRSPKDVVYLGTLPSDGAPVVYNLQLPDLGPGVESTTTYLQLMIQNPAWPRRLSGVSTLVVLDSAF